MLQCDAINGGLPVYTWKIRVSFVVYIIAIVTTIGKLSSLSLGIQLQEQVSEMPTALHLCLPDQVLS